MTIVPEESGRDRILSVARDLFIERGFAEVSMQQIAEAANLRKASIYHHFPSKVDLFVAVTKREIDALYEQTTIAVATSDDLVPQLRAIARVWFSEFRGDHMRMVRDIYENVPVNQQLAFEAQLSSFIATIAGTFERAATAGQIRPIDPRIAAAVFFDIVSGWVYRAYADPESAPADPDAAVALMTDILLFGIATPSFAQQHHPDLDLDPPAGEPRALPPPKSLKIVS
jgi:AcrR family transcriptional regulator